MHTIKELHIIALASHGVGISGGDRIWIELTRRWQKHFPVKVHTWKEGVEMAERQSLNEQKTISNKQRLRFIKYKVPFCNLGFVICYLARIVQGTWIGLTIKLQNSDDVYIYNASEFWMDAIPCILLKIRFSKVTWVATWYQTAPNPFKGFSEKERSGESYKFTALLYWLTQFPVKPFITRYADFVIVNNDDERKQFTGKKTVVLIGAVPLDGIKNYELRSKNNTKKYDAVFQGRFHAQKGVEELIEIWKDVVVIMPSARLAMIGDGPLMYTVKSKIKKFKLESNIDLFGFLFDGKKKYDIFANSKMVLHPSFFDSGGMATAEAMAFGIPAIGFDLKAYESYYPKGMVKVKTEEEFAKVILKLLKDEKLRNKVGKEAKDLIERKYSWDQRAKEVLFAIQ